IDQDRERRNRRDVNRPWNDGTRANREVYAVEARRVPGRQNILPDRGLLLSADLRSSLRPNAGAGLLCRVLILGLRRILILRRAGSCLVLLAGILILLLCRLIHLRRLALLVRGSLAGGLALFGRPLILLRHAVFLASALTGCRFLAGLCGTLGFKLTVF